MKTLIGQKRRESREGKPSERQRRETEMFPEDGKNNSSDRHCRAAPDGSGCQPLLISLERKFPETSDDTQYRGLKISMCYDKACECMLDLPPSRVSPGPPHPRPATLPLNLRCGRRREDASGLVSIPGPQFLLLEDVRLFSEARTLLRAKRRTYRPATRGLQPGGSVSGKGRGLVITCGGPANGCALCR